MAKPPEESNNDESNELSWGVRWPMDSTQHKNALDDFTR